ncbi:MAG: hypothetical protein M1825_004744 [Sarcosagium campestre]|nr:MAG: hypothetical protein M1825_004744 [Sarcosagium campestre]
MPMERREQLPDEASESSQSLPGRRGATRSNQFHLTEARNMLSLNKLIDSDNSDRKLLRSHYPEDSTLAADIVPLSPTESTVSQPPLRTPFAAVFPRQVAPLDDVMPYDPWGFSSQAPTDPDPSPWSRGVGSSGGATHSAHLQTRAPIGSGPSTAPLPHPTVFSSHGLGFPSVPYGPWAGPLGSPFHPPAPWRMNNPASPSAQSSPVGEAPRVPPGLPPPGLSFPMLPPPGLPQEALPFSFADEPSRMAWHPVSPGYAPRGYGHPNNPPGVHMQPRTQPMQPQAQPPFAAAVTPDTRRMIPGSPINPPRLADQARPSSVMVPRHPRREEHPSRRETRRRSGSSSESVKSGDSRAHGHGKPCEGSQQSGTSSATHYTGPSHRRSRSRQNAMPVHVKLPTRPGMPPPPDLRNTRGEGSSSSASSSSARAGHGVIRAHVPPPLSIRPVEQSQSSTTSHARMSSPLRPTAPEFRQLQSSGMAFVPQTPPPQTWSSPPRIRNHPAPLPLRAPRLMRGGQVEGPTQQTGTRAYDMREPLLPPPGFNSMRGAAAAPLNLPGRPAVVGNPHFAAGPARFDIAPPPPAPWLPPLTPNERPTGERATGPAAATAHHSSGVRASEPEQRRIRDLVAAERIAARLPEYLRPYAPTSPTCCLTPSPPRGAFAQPLGFDHRGHRPSLRPHIPPMPEIDSAWHVLPTDRVAIELRRQRDAEIAASEAAHQPLADQTSPRPDVEWNWRGKGRNRHWASISSMEDWLGGFDDGEWRWGP